MRSQLSQFLLLVLIVALAIVSLERPGAASDFVPLSVSLTGMHEIAASELPGGIVEVQTLGTDPYLFTNPLPENTDLPANSILEFEYFSLTGTGEVQAFLIPPSREEGSVRALGLSRSEGWSRYQIDLSPAVKSTDVNVKNLRMDFGREAGKTFQIRNIVLRRLNDTERATAAKIAETAAREAERDNELRGYLSQDMTSKIQNVAVDATNIEISGIVEMNGKNEGDSDNWLVEIPVFAESSDTDSLTMVQRILPDGSGNFSYRTARYTGEGRDRLFSRWAVAWKSDEQLSLRSHGHYADKVAPRAGLTPALAKGRKGLGAFSPGRPIEDVADLGSSAVTINLLLQSLFEDSPQNNGSVYEHGGRRWHLNDSVVARIDESVRLAAELRQIVSAIVLIGPAGNSPEGSFRRTIAHPDADPAGIYVMPNLTTAEGVAAYGAALNFLAERYSRPDGKYGRIHHWIIHNEVNSGWVWTNMGVKSALRYMDVYHKSMRMAQLIAWQFDPNAKVYISLEHHWDSVFNPHCYRGKEMLELLLEFGRAEGDFPWALAYHPYPEDLRNPRAWDDKSAWFSFDTPRITFRNIEVLDAWMKRPAARYLGQFVRDVQFTEQGPNSPDYSEEALRDQAACMAYVWKKMESLDSISMFHFHNWEDNRHEGGLRIGLRRFPDDEVDPRGKKPVWYVFRALGTSEQSETIDFAKELIGIHDWDEVVHRGTITETTSKDRSTTAQDPS